MIFGRSRVKSEDFYQLKKFIEYLKSHQYSQEVLLNPKYEDTFAKYKLKLDDIETTSVVLDGGKAMNNRYSIDMFECCDEGSISLSPVSESQDKDPLDYIEKKFANG
jgi:hypothetical protein